jgi:hypothetical protein
MDSRQDRMRVARDNAQRPAEEAARLREDTARLRKKDAHDLWLVQRCSSVPMTRPADRLHERLLADDLHDTQHDRISASAGRKLPFFAHGYAHSSRVWR